MGETEEKSRSFYFCIAGVTYTLGQFAHTGATEKAVASMPSGKTNGKVAEGQKVH